MNGQHNLSKNQLYFSIQNLSFCQWMHLQLPLIKKSMTKFHPSAPRLLWCTHFFYGFVSNFNDTFFPANVYAPHQNITTTHNSHKKYLYVASFGKSERPKKKPKIRKKWFIQVLSSLSVYSKFDGDFDFFFVAGAEGGKLTQRLFFNGPSTARYPFANPHVKWTMPIMNVKKETRSIQKIIVHDKYIRIQQIMAGHHKFASVMRLAKENKKNVMTL